MDCSDHDGFSETARDHAENPRNYGPLTTFNGHAQITGPCGDTMEFWLLARDGRIEKVSFETDGCGSSLACGSIATCLAEGKTLEIASCIPPQCLLVALGGLPPEFEHCALLAVNTLRAACEDFRLHGKLRSV